MVKKKIEDKIVSNIKKRLKRIDFQKVNQESQVKKITILVFIWSTFLFFLQLQYNFLDEYDIVLFWLPILIMIGTVIFQIFSLKNNTFVLFEIFIIYLFLHLIYQTGIYGLRGSDSYFDYNNLKTILYNHNFRLEPGIQGYPMIHIFSSIITTITKIDPLIIAKFLPSFISSIIILPIYILVYNVYKNKQVSLLVCLIFGTVPQFMDFEVSFIREVFGLFFLISFFCILYVSLRRKDYRFILLTLILIPVVIFSHHFSAFLLLSLLVIYFLTSLVIIPNVYRFILYLFRKSTNVLRFLSGKINREIIIISVIFLASLLGYVIFLYGSDFFPDFFQDMYYNIFGYGYSERTYAETIGIGYSPIVTLRGNIIFYGFFTFNMLFALILFIKFFTKNIKQKIEDVTFTLFYFYCIFLGFLTLFVISGEIFPDRFLPFALIFGLIPISSLMFVIKKNVYKKVLAIILMSFIVFNLYNVNPTYYTENASFTEGAVTEKEYLIANRISFPDEYYGYIAVVSAIYDIQEIKPRSEGRDLSLLIYFNAPLTMAVINEEVYLDYLENMQKKSQEEHSRIVEILSYKDNKDVHKICDFGHIYIIKGE